MSEFDTESSASTESQTEIETAEAPAASFSEPVALPEDAHIPTLPQLFVALGLLLAVFSVPYLTPFFHFNKVAPTETHNAIGSSTQKALTYRGDLFDSIDLEAQSAYVWDVSLQRALYNKNAHSQLPLASLTKLMTALIVSEASSRGENVSITHAAIQQEGESGFSEGELWQTKDLLDYTLMTSSNDGAYALAGSVGAALLESNATPESSFLHAMNKKADEIGLTQTYYTNPTGLDSSQTQSGSYGSARDMAFLMEYIIKNEPTLLSKTTEKTASFTNSNGAPFTATNTNQAIGTIDNALGSKTGYTDLARGNLVVALDIGLNHPVIISVLGSSREGRFKDVQMLIERVRKSYIPQP